jgi:hypothetical protein
VPRFSIRRKKNPQKLDVFFLDQNRKNYRLYGIYSTLWWAVFLLSFSYRYQSADLEIDDWRMWRHEWFSLVIALKICMISRSAKRAIKGVLIPLYVSLITWKWKNNYFYSILEVLWKIKKSCHLSFNVSNSTVKNIFGKPKQTSTWVK